MKLKGRVAIVTGAGAGIGEATAVLFAKEGAKVCCNSLSKSALRVVNKIKDFGVEAIFVQSDVSIENNAKKIVEETVNKYTKIDILLNNAGIVLPGKLENTSIEDWERSMAVNVRGVFLVSKSAIFELKKTNGVIINTSSAVALKGVKDRFAYSATKGAINSLTRSMAIDYIEDGIRVNCICPGTIDTPSLANRLSRFDDLDKARKDFIARQPQKRLGTPKEIAESMLFLVLNEFCTGICLTIDGGMTM